MSAILKCHFFKPGEVWFYAYTKGSHIEGLLATHDARVTIPGSTFEEVIAKARWTCPGIPTTLEVKTENSGYQWVQWERSKS